MSVFKKSFFVLIILTFVFSGTSFAEASKDMEQLNVQRFYPGSTLIVQPGDILVTNNTSSGGLTGHTSFVIESGGTNLSIAGYGYNRELQSLDTWFANNPNTKVVRYGNPMIATAAAQWAENYYFEYPIVTYGLLNTLGNKSEIYCSKIPWLAFYLGASVSVNGKTPFCNCLITPYDWLNLNGFSVVLVKGNW